MRQIAKQNGFFEGGTYETHGTYIDGKSEIGAQVRSTLCYLLCLRLLIRSKSVTDWIFSLSGKTHFPSCVLMMY